MKLLPLITEKTTTDAEKGVYTFVVDPLVTKTQIKKAVSETFGVTVVNVRTVNYKGSRRKNFRGRFRTIKPLKKAMVTLGEKDKIDLFESKKK